MEKSWSEYGPPAMLGPFHTFAVFINNTGQNEATEGSALSLFSFLITWLVMLSVLLTGRRSGASLGGAK